MVKINIFKSQSLIKEVNLTGHANYNDYGKDIVCSSISSIVITTVNGIIKTFGDDYLRVDQKKDILNIKVLKENEQVNSLMINMIDLLEELSQDYNENIKIQHKEV